LEEVRRRAVVRALARVWRNRHKGVWMMESRRKFLTILLASGLPIGFVNSSAQSQGGGGTQPSPKPVQKDEDTDEPRIDSKAMLEANQKDIKKSVERLFHLASELKAEVEKTDSVQVLSVPMLKKAEEIEKLAKSIRSRAIG
jgi:hypothetical protein